jgi:alpha-glucosidase
MELSSIEQWYRRAVLYHIYPLSFSDDNGDGFGDLRGIIRHIDYLHGNNDNDESLGVSAIWLSPIYLSPWADWGYDVADHKMIDPRFGTMQDFDNLLAQVHGRGMKLLMDYVPNHTSIEHQWFKKSRSQRQNDKRDWYIWADPSDDGGPPNNWLSSFGGPAWTYDENSRQYYMHTFLPEQPDLNWRNPLVREAMLDVLQFWLDKGVDGFRADAVLGLLKDEQLRDDPPNPNFRPGISDPADEFLRIHSAGQRELNATIGSFCDVLAKKQGTYLLSEAYLNIPGLQHLYEACKTHPIHAPFNFNLMSLNWGARSYREFIDSYELALGPNDWPNYVLGNHDRHRLATRIGQERARLLGLMQLTLRGLPVVYYGEELGLYDTKVQASEVRDPWELRVPGHGLGRDGARGPMPWSDEIGAGFTTNNPWLPVARDHEQLNVDAERRDPESSLNLYRHLIQIRNNSPALMDGIYRSIEVNNPYIYAFVRETEVQKFLIVLNFDQHHAKCTLHGPVGNWVIGTHLVDGDGLVPIDNTITLAPYEGRVYEFRRGLG